MRNLPKCAPFYKIPILWSLKKFLGITVLLTPDVCAGISNLFEHGNIKNSDFLRTVDRFLFWLSMDRFSGLYMFGYHPEHHHIGPRHDNN